MTTPCWIFTYEDFKNLKSIHDGMDKQTEGLNRHKSALMITMAGQRLRLIRLVTNTAIVYMHRFYMLQSMVKYPIEDMSPVFLYLATKIEEDFKAPKYIFEAFKLKPGESNDQQDLKRREELLFHHEKILVQTLGFDFIIDHPHSLIDSAGRQLKLPKDIVNTAFFIATFSLHVTCLSLMYSRSYLAVLCIFVACKWAKYELPKNPEKPWWHVVDPNLNLVKFERILDYLDNTCGKCPQNQMVLLTKAKIYDRNGDLRSYQDFINEPALNGQSHQSENNEKPVHDTISSSKRKLQADQIEPKRPTSEIVANQECPNV